MSLRATWLLLCLLSFGGGLQAAELRVLCAASLTDVMPALAADYAQRGGARPAFSFAASSVLARQIEAGATADVFVSADEAWMDYLEDRDLLVAGNRRALAQNRLVLIGTPDVARTAGNEPLQALPHLLGQGRLALGDPAHVPAGRYAAAALKALGLWEEVASRLVPAESVRVALLYVARGEAPLGVVYATDVRGVKGVQVLAEIPAATHPAITYPAAAVAAGNRAAAAAFLEYLAGPASRHIWTAHGFAPGEGRATPH